jgi:hypothetical protein
MKRGDVLAYVVVEWSDFCPTGMITNYSDPHLLFDIRTSVVLGPAFFAVEKAWYRVQKLW